MFANLIFFLIIEVGLSKIVSNVIDLHHNKKIEGGRGNMPPPAYFEYYFQLTISTQCYTSKPMF